MEALDELVQVLSSQGVGRRIATGDRHLYDGGGGREPRPRHVSGRSAAPGQNKVRKSSIHSRNPLATKYRFATGESRPRLEIRDQDIDTNAGLLADRNRRHGVVHRRYDLTLHGCALGIAPAASLPRSGAAGSDL